MAATVLFIDHTAKLGGGEIFLLNLLPLLAREVRPIVLLFDDGPLRHELERRNIEVKVFRASGAVVNSTRDSVSHFSGDTLQRGLSAVKMSLQLARVISSLKPDVVHTNNLKACLIGGVATQLAGKPLVWHIHDRISEDYLPMKLVRVVRMMARLMPHAVIANSLATQATLRMQRSKLTRVIYPGVNVQGAVRKPARSQPIKIGIVGRLSEWKGQHIFLEIAADVLKEYPRTEWVIVGAALFGEDDYSDQLKARAAQSDLRGHVVFRGFQSDVVAEMQNLDIIMHCSTSPEPFGQVITEAMALQKPVIATRAGGVLEIIEDGKSGLLVEMGNVNAASELVKMLIEKPLVAKVLGENGRKRVIEHFTIEASAEATLALYSDILGYDRPHNDGGADSNRVEENKPRSATS